MLKEFTFWFAIIIAILSLWQAHRSLNLAKRANKLTGEVFDITAKGMISMCEQREMQRWKIARTIAGIRRLTDKNGLVRITLFDKELNELLK